MRVVVTITPLKGLVRPLLPPDADVTVLIPQGRSEHGYELTFADRRALASADMVVDVGLHMVPQVEAYVRDHPAADRRDVCFADAVGVKAEAGAGHEHAEHDETDEHDHGATDPHLWLDPGLVAGFVPVLREQVYRAEEMRGAMTPEAVERLDRGAGKLVADVAALDGEDRTRLKPFAGRAIITHHAAWRRLAQRYELRVAAVIRPIETSEATPEAVWEAVKAVREQHATVIFVEPEFSPQAAERIAERTGVRTAILKPLGDGDWFRMMRENLDALTENLGR